MKKNKSHAIKFNNPQDSLPPDHLNMQDTTAAMRNPKPAQSPARSRLLPSQHPQSFLTAALLKIYSHSILGQIPRELYLCATALSASIANSNKEGWRIQLESESQEYPRIGERRTVKLIVWAKVVDGGIPIWAGEIMIHLMGSTGVVENVAWRLGGGVGETDGENEGMKCEGGWEDWRMAHLVDYHSLTFNQGEASIGTKGLGDIPIIELKMSQSVLEETFVDAVHQAVKVALGKPFEPKKEELRDRLRRIMARLEMEVKSITGLEVMRKFRMSMGKSKHYLPTAFVLARASKGGQGDDLSKAEEASIAATIIIDVFTHGAVKLMGVLYAGEEPMVHFYRSRYPPPDPRSILRVSGKAKGGEQDQIVQEGLEDDEPVVMTGLESVKVSKQERTGVKLDPVVEDLRG